VTLKNLSIYCYVHTHTHTTGAYSLEVLIVLLCLKLRYHPHVVLLRGNHEEKMMNQQFGFIDEIESRLGSKNGMCLYDDEIYPLFQVLPLAARIDKRILCIHGGPGVHVKSTFTLDVVALRPTLPLYTHHRSLSLSLSLSPHTHTHTHQHNVRS